MKDNQFFIKIIRIYFKFLNITKIFANFPIQHYNTNKDFKDLKNFQKPWKNWQIFKYNITKLEHKI